MFTYKELLASFSKGLRHGNWKRLSRVDKQKAAASGARIFNRGLEKAVAFFLKGEARGIFAGAPSLRKWLKDSRFILILGPVSRILRGERIRNHLKKQKTI